MHVYLIAAMQCYAKAAAHLRKEVLPTVMDPQTRTGIEFCIEYAEQEATNIQKAGEAAEKK